MSQADASDTDSLYDWSWFARGMAQVFSLPALILISAFVGFGGLAREAGISLGQLIFMVPTVWALPSHLILVSGIAAGVPLLAIIPAVALAAVRMMPMTMALVPEIRVPGSKAWHLLLVSNMIAITAWMHTIQKAPEIPRPGRLPFFAGFAGIMMVATTVVSGLVHQLAATFPVPVMAALYFLTPIYFAASSWNTARVKAEHLALILGFALGPLLFIVVPQANILFAGIIGGFAAFAFHKIASRGKGS
ncbi:MAG: AzlC family ABC transporter permease [Rhizobiaceae bacterium]|nr:AzlC family ABC transporter permease [Hyphomicrobiales bacterium]NRB31448.1 AzlC family ABC transporter permease [Rhizobiaceae bacterium]